MDNLKLKDLKNKKVHFIGIGGISMSALAQMLLKEKIFVQGSDESENEEVKKLKKKGINVFSEHKISNLKIVDVVVYSSAISEDNCELAYAKKMNLIIIKRAELLALIASEYKTIISVAGSHGKTTATAMISEVFLNAGLNPTIHLGGVLNKIKSNYRIGSKKFFITESCEYKNNYLYLHPDLSVILNIDADHLDYFKSLENVQKSFCKFTSNIRNGGLNFICVDDKNSNCLLKSANCVKFGLNNANIQANNIKEYSPSLYSFDVIFEGFMLGNIKLNIFGKHNIYNALASVFVGLMCGIDFYDIKNSIETFSGTKRRTEFVCKLNGAFVYHDYAHHPKQIKEMVEVGKRLICSKGGKLYIVFEPHTYSRTKYLLDDFADSFIGANEVMLTPVYSARENISNGFSSEILFNEVLKRGICSSLFYNFNDIKLKLNKIVSKDDIVFILGAGSVEKLANMLKNNAKNIKIN